MSWLDRLGLRAMSPAQKRQAAISAAFQEVYATEAGRLALDWLLDECGLMKPIFEVGTDAARLGFLAGKHYVATEIANRLGFTPAAAIELDRRLGEEAQRRVLESEEGQVI